MARKIYTGIDGTARRVRKLYTGVSTEVPLYEERETTETKTATITSSNNTDFFTTSKSGSYGTSTWGSSGYSAQLQVYDETSTFTLTAKKDMDLSLSYSTMVYGDVGDNDAYSSLTIAGKVVYSRTENSTGGTWSGTLSYGQTIVIKIEIGADPSNYISVDLTKMNATYDETVTEKVQIGTEIKEVARRIKKAYVGVNGVARLFYNYAMQPYTVIDSIPTLAQGAVTEAIGASVGNYALVAGGRGSGSFSEVSGVTAYDASFTKSSPSSLDEKRGAGAGASIGNYALIAGGYRGVLGGYKHLSTVDVYSSSLTHTTATSLSTAKEYLAAANAGDYAFFGGGENSASGTAYSTVDAYNKSLTKYSVSGLSAARGSLAAASVGNYILFGGGRNGSSCSNVVDVYDNSLTKLTPINLPVAVRDLAAASVDGYAFFAGGYDGSSYHKDIAVFSESLTLTTGQELFYAVDGLVADSMGNNAVFAGGYEVVTIIDSSGTISTPRMIAGTNKTGMAASTVGNYMLFSGGYNGSYSNATSAISFKE